MSPKRALEAAYALVFSTISVPNRSFSGPPSLQHNLNPGIVVVSYPQKALGPQTVVF